MARSRSIPCAFFEDPDIFPQTSDTQIVLVGLLVNADDAGRGLAHFRLLSRKIDKPEAMIEQAFPALVASNLVRYYEVRGQYYYELTRWDEWETLSKPTPSKYPAPPSKEPEQDHAGQHEGSPNSPGKSGEILGTLGKDFLSPNSPGKSKKNPLEVEVEEEVEREREEEDEEKQHHGDSRVIPFPLPTPTTRDGSDSERRKGDENESEQALIAKVGHILHLPVTEALMRIVQEFQHEPTLSLLGEADAARAYIDDTKRNSKRQNMNAAFFRRWLKRERGDYAPKGKEEPGHPAREKSAASVSPTRQSLMDLGAQYRASRQSPLKETHHG